MVRDRLDELRAKSSQISENDISGENVMNQSPNSDNASNTVGTSNMQPDWSEEQLDQCLHVITKIEKQVKTMRDDVEHMNKLQKNIISNPLIDPNEAKHLEQISDKVFNMSSMIRKEIDQCRTVVEAMHMVASHERLIKNHINKLEKDLTRTTNDFRAEQVKYIDQTQQLHQREIEIAHGNDVGYKVEETGGYDNMHMEFAGDYFVEASRVKRELREIEARNMEIQKIEISVIEVNQLFKEVNALVMTQGDTIDTIEKHVEESVSKVEMGNISLSQAQIYMASTRRRKVSCIGVLVVTLIIVATVISIVIISQIDNN